MRKTIISPGTIRPRPDSDEGWLDLERIARVEVTSEDPNFPIESCFAEQGPGWKAAEKGTQSIRLVFDELRPIRRIRLEFLEQHVARTQEFALRWSAEPNGPFREIVRQQWNFTPQGSTSEIEDYQVDLDRVSALELAINPDLGRNNAVATLARWLVA
jgi:hypothetical protein